MKGYDVGNCVLKDGLCEPSSKPQECCMIISVTRVATTVAAIAGLVASGGSVATAASSVGRCELGHHDACVSAGGAVALSPYRLERILRRDAGHVLATAIRRSARPRIVVHARPPYPMEERGAIYGYAPGSYLLGRAGVLYGPYPLNPDAPIAELRY
jgi:hypothetical protein